MVLILFFLWMLAAGTAVDPINKGVVRLVEELLDSSRSVEDSDFGLALALAKEAEVKVEAVPSPLLYAKLFNQYGRIYFKIGQVDLAAEYFHRSRYQLASIKRKAKELVSAELGLAAINLFLHRYDEARALFEQATKDLESMEEWDDRSHSAIYNSMGIIYRETDELILAFETLTKGIAKLEAINPKNQDLPLLYDNLARLHAKMGNYQQAIAVAETGLTLAEELDNVSGIVTAYTSLGDFYLEKGIPQTALYYFRSGYERAKTANVLVVQHACAGRLAKLYKELDRMDSSLFFLETKESLYKWINADKAAQKVLIEELRSRYELEKQTLSGRVVSRYRLLWIILAILLLLGLFSYIRIRFFREKYQEMSLATMDLRRKAEQVTIDKQLLQAQLEDKNKQLTAKLLCETKRNRIIKDVVAKLMEQRSQFSAEGKRMVGGIIRTLNESYEDGILDEFETTFLNLHVDFYENLLRDFPNLTQNERRLCAFIRLNLTAAEITALTGQTTSTLNMAKTRLRKKLGLTNASQELYDFLAKY